MPLYYFKCDPCNKVQKRIFSPARAKETQTCPSCSGVLARYQQDVFTTVKESIDNGLQAKRVEQFANSPDLVQEREQQQRELKIKDEL